MGMAVSVNPKLTEFPGKRPWRLINVSKNLLKVSL